MTKTHMLKRVKILHSNNYHHACAIIVDVPLSRINTCIQNVFETPSKFQVCLVSADSNSDS